MINKTVKRFHTGRAFMKRLDDFEPCSVAGRPYRVVKRALDMVCAGLLLAVLAIPLGVIALLVRRDDGGRVLFRQERIGLGGKPFFMYKFRTMKPGAPSDVPSRVQKESAYVTEVGRVLRKYSLDELPQLVNVLKGDMSLVGPRPLIVPERDIHELRERFGVYSVRPGLTGLAQIHGRDSLGAREKVLWDVTYLHHFGLWTDLSILLQTVPQVLGGSGGETKNTRERKK
jgi:O-antigen biosynthesis protein WbqP